MATHSGEERRRGEKTSTPRSGRTRQSTRAAQSPRTVTRKLPLLTLPAASVALQVTVEIPIRKKLPEAGEQLTLGAGSTLSGALTLEATTGPRKVGGGGLRETRIDSKST